MSAKKALIGLGAGVSMGIGTAYAVHQVGELNARASRIEACIEHNELNEVPHDDCEDGPLAITEAKGYRDTANMLGSLGWIAFAGAAYSTVKTYEMLDGEDS